MRRHFPTGRVVIAFVPTVRNPDLLLKAVSNTPILENSRKVKRIMKSTVGGENV
jgi:hypothetical protein